MLNERPVYPGILANFGQAVSPFIAGSRRKVCDHARRAGVCSLCCLYTVESTARDIRRSLLRFGLSERPIVIGALARSEVPWCYPGGSQACRFYMLINGKLSPVSQLVTHRWSTLCSRTNRFKDEFQTSSKNDRVCSADASLGADSNEQCSSTTSKRMQFRESQIVKFPSLSQLEILVFIVDEDRLITRRSFWTIRLIQGV